MAYNVQTLATLSAMIDVVSDKLNRGAISSSTMPSDSQVADYLVRAKEEIAETKNYTWRRVYSTATLTAGTYRYSLPSDFDHMTHLRDITNDNFIRIISDWQFDILYPDLSEEATGTILIACVKNMELWVAPPPDGSDVLEIEYMRSGDDTTAGDFTWLPEIERWRCIDFALMEAFELLHEWDKASYYRDKWVGGVKKARLADGKRKWSGVDFRARSVFQA